MLIQRETILKKNNPLTVLIGLAYKRGGGESSAVNRSLIRDTVC